MVENKKFLDHAGLTTLWGIITNRFADKDKTLTALEISANDTKTVQTIVATLADGTTTKQAALPNATREQAGLMSADHFSMVEDLTANIEEMAPFAGLQLKNKDYTEEVSLTGRKATIELKYEKDDTNNKAYISLLDPTYPATGEWQTRTKEQYESALAAVPEGSSLVGWASYKAKESQVTSYWQWSVPGETGPLNALGKPIEKKPISKIDVSELLRSNLLSETDVVVMNGKTQLKLGFLVTNGGVESVEYQYIDVTDLVDIYVAGDGVKIESTSVANPGTDGSLDDTATTTTISLEYATAAKRGAMRTGYTAAEGAIRHYAVNLVTEGDDAGKAYVVVPWDTHDVEIISTGKTANEEQYITVTDLIEEPTDNGDGSKKYTHKWQIEVAEGLKKAEALSRTGAQEITGDTGYVTATPTALGAAGNEGKNWAITLDQTVKDSLALADSAVQSVAVDVVDRDGRSTGTNDLAIVLDKENPGKGEKDYTITLGDRTVESLQNADSAIQTINLFGTDIRDVNDNSNVNVAYTEEQLTKDVKLGNAIKVNVSSTISKSDDTTDKSAASYDATGETKIDNVPTVKAVKTYVESVKGDIATDYQGYVTSAIEALDSNMEAETVDATSTAQEEVAQTVFTKIVIKDGKLVAPGVEGGSEVKALTLSDITDFRAFTSDEIKAICI